MSAVNAGAERIRKRNRAGRERALVAAASRLFAAQGFEVTTTRQIAAEAGCAEGLIHRYFNGKAGLLMAIIESRMAREMTDLTKNLPVQSNLQDEIRQLAEFELDHMWEEREFMRVIIPRALVDPAFGELVARTGPAQRAKAITERLKKTHTASHLSKQELQALAHGIGILGFMFGFMRPVVLGQDRQTCRELALALARFVARGAEESDVTSPYEVYSAAQLAHK